MSSKKTRDTSKSKRSSKDDYPTRDTSIEKSRRTSKDYESRHAEKSGSHRTKSKSSSKPVVVVDEDAAALAEEEEERRRRRKQRKLLEEEERARQEQQQADEEHRRRKEKDKHRDLDSTPTKIENGESRKHKSSRVKSPPRDPSPPPPPAKHKSKAVERDDNYSDDFEQAYEDDFDDESALPPPPPSTKKSRSTYDEKPSTSIYSDDRGNSQMYSGSRRFYSQDLSDRIRGRYKDLSRLIELDRQSFHILEMTPMPAHAAYMRDIRSNSKKNTNTTAMDDETGWTANIKTQTNDDAENVHSQTDEIDTRAMWTQHPMESEHAACGSGSSGNNDKHFSDVDKARESEELLRMLRLETDLGRYQTFISNAGKLILALLDEQQSGSTSGGGTAKSKSKRTKDNDEQEGMQQESDLNFSSGLTVLSSLPLPSEVPVAAVCFCQDKPEQVAVFYEPIHTTSYGAIYSVYNPEKPLRLLSCEASIRCCCSSIAYLFAGCHDGSVVVFDTTEPNRYKIDTQELIPSSPTFSTANIQFNDRHYNEVIRVLPLRTTNLTNKIDREKNSFSLASLDRDGHILLWSVVELTQSDEAGSFADLGLKPGGRVRMTQTSSIQIRQSINMIRDSIQTYDIASPINDVDNLYVASNASAVYHMTRYGDMGSPSKLRLSSALESQIEVTCLAFNPMVNKLLLVGTGHGQLSLYTTGRDEPILTWPQAFRASSTVLSCAWSAGRPSIFFAHDSLGQIKYWDLTVDLIQSLGNVTIDNLSHFVVSTSDRWETAFVLVVRQRTRIEIHQLKRTFATRSETFTEKFKTILKEMMTNA